MADSDFLEFDQLNETMERIATALEVIAAAFEPQMKVPGPINPLGEDEQMTREMEAH